MRAVVIHEAGDLDRLVFEDVERPSPGAGQVLVRVRAVGVCHRDLLDREGHYPFMKRPVVTGHELAGEIVEAAPDVTDFAVGDCVTAVHRAACGACDTCRAGDELRCGLAVRAFGLTIDGAYAEYVVADAAALVRVPTEVTLPAAAFLHCTAAVALRALRDRGGLRAGETVLITGASGGVGVHAIQVARILGARVIALTSKAEKADALRALGADAVVVATGAFQRAVLAESGGGVDVALDLVGAPTFNSSLRSLRTGGRLVLVGNVTAERVELNPGWVILREPSIIGSASASRRDLAEVLDWAARGRLVPVIAETRPLGEAREAQARLARQDVVGRIVLVP